ncbi:hypothetical protein N9F16_00280 [bacterium]|nr:hypothetical protein [bacterium]
METKVVNKFKGNRRVGYDGKDQYFTKRSVTQKYTEITNKLFPFKDYDLILEPSAGEGAFLDYLPKNKSLGIDIDPQRKDVVKQDFFEYSTNKKTLTIGNPPFGIRNKLSVRFFNHAANFSDTIAFIIPNPWKMYSIHKRLDSRFKLVYEEQIEPFSFLKQGESRGKRHLGDNSTNVNCVFQIWTKEETDLPDLRKYEKDPKSHPDFTTYGYFADKNNIEDGLDYDFLIRAWGGMPFAKRGPGRLSTGTVHDNGDNLKGNWRMQYTAIKAHKPYVREIIESIPIEDWWVCMSSMSNIPQELLIMKYIEYKNKKNNED